MRAEPPGDTRRLTPLRALAKSERFRYRLERTPLLVVKGVVQEEDHARFETEAAKLPAKLVEAVRSQSPGQQGTQMLAAQVQLHGPPRLQWECEVA